MMLLPSIRPRCATLCVAILLLVTGASAQDYSKSEISEVFRGLRFADGPAWSPAGFLVFSDVPNNRIVRYSPGGPIRMFRENAAGAAGNAFDKHGQLYTAESISRRITRTSGDEVTTLVSEFQGKALNGPNDIAVRQNGDVFFTDPAFASAEKTREQPHHGLYRISSKGEIFLVKAFSTRITGLAFSPDQDTLYVSDSDRRLVLAIELNGRGEAKQVRDFVSIPESIPAGLCVDKRGSVYVAADAIVIFDKNGQRLGRFNVPEKPSDCTFGEPDGMGLFVTARTAVYRFQSPVEGLLPH